MAVRVARVAPCTADKPSGSVQRTWVFWVELRSLCVDFPCVPGLHEAKAPPNTPDVNIDRHIDLVEARKGVLVSAQYGSSHVGLLLAYPLELVKSLYNLARGAAVRPDVFRITAILINQFLRGRFNPTGNIVHESM